MRYNFLVLTLLFAVPGAVIFFLRRDLRRPIGIMAACSIPFAFTEFLFYPEYWEPVFLFDLADRIGFGIEDLLFVTGLAAFTSTAYAAILRRTFEPIEGAGRPWARSAVVLGVTGALVVGVALAKIPMIYGSFAIMLVMTAVMCAFRRDLIVPGVLGALCSLAIYSVACWVFAWIFPSVFEMTWHTEKFLGVFVLGLPLEELMYGFAAGAAATVFYPFVTQQRFRTLE